MHSIGSGSEFQPNHGKNTNKLFILVKLGELKCLMEGDVSKNWNLSYTRPKVSGGRDWLPTKAKMGTRIRHI
jgi:hypothetical protein